MTDWLPQVLMIVSALILFVLGSVHLVFTFHGTRLHPRDVALIERLRNESPVITTQTTLWRAWIGFNASHSLGAILFGAVYGYLGLMEPDLLFDSMFLGFIGVATLASYTWLGYAYWFRTPFMGIFAALVCYLFAFGLSFA